MLIRRLLVCFIALALMLPCIAWGENAADNTYYTIEFEYTDENGEPKRGVAYERLDFEVIKDASGTNIWFQWNPQGGEIGYEMPQIVQIFYWIPDGVGSVQYPVLDPVTMENEHALFGTEFAPASLLLRLPDGDEYKQFVLSTASPQELGINWQGGVDEYWQDDNYLDDNYLDDNYLDDTLIYPQIGESTDIIDITDETQENYNQGIGATQQRTQGNIEVVNNSAERNVPAPTDGMGTIGTVLNDNTVLYAIPYQGEVTTLPRDTVIRLGELIPGQNPMEIDGKLWYMVAVENNPMQAGYLILDAFQLMTPEQEQAHMATYGQAQQVPGFNTQYAYMNINGAQLRHSPNGMPISGAVSGSAIAQYLPGVAAPYGYDSYNRLWIYVKLDDGREGYIRLDDVTFMTPQQQADHEKPVQEMPTLNTSYANSNKNLNMLLDQNTLQEIDTVRQGDTGKYLGKSQTINKDIWLLMEFPGNKIGYVKYDDMTFLTKEQEQQYLLSIKETPKLPSLPSAHAEIKANMTPILDPVTKQQISTLDAGQIGEFLATDPNAQYIDGNKDLWILMQYGNKKGYVKYDTASLSFLSAQQERDYLNANKPEQQLPKLESSYARANANSTQVIDITTKSPVKLLNKNDAMQFLSYRSDWKYVDPADTDKKLWLLVEYEPGMVGYVKLDTVTFMTASEEKAYLATAVPSNSPSPSPSPTATATATATAVIIPTQNPMTPKVSGLMKTNAQTTVLYYWYNVGLPKAGLSKGTVVYVQEQMYDSANTNWSFVQYETPNGVIDGYILSSYLTPMSSAEQEAYYINRQPVSPSPKPTYSLNNFSGYLLITTNQVNFRSGPSTTSSIKQRLQFGSIVRAVGVENMNDGYSWYLCESQGQVGYVRGDNIRELTVQEYQNVVSAPSYTQSGNVITPVATAKPISGIDYSNWATQVPNANATISFQTIPPLPTGTPIATLDPNASVSPSASIDPFATPGTDASGQGLLSPSPYPFGSALPTIDPDFPTEDAGGSPTGLIVASAILVMLGGGGLYGYSIYNKTRRKQAQEQAQRLAAEARRKAQQAEKELGNPAVRRPVPLGGVVQPGQTKPGQSEQPTQPGQRPAQTGQTGQPGQPGAKAQPGQRPGQPAQAGQTAQPGATPVRPGAQQSAAARPGAVPPVNPYARPQSAQPAKPRTQEVVSTAPRAQVDGKPVDGGASQPQQGTQPKKPPVYEGQGPGVQDASGGMYAPPQPSLFARPATEQKPRMPVAPSPIQSEESQGDEESQTTRRRRRRQDGATPQQDQETDV